LGAAAPAKLALHRHQSLNLIDLADEVDGETDAATDVYPGRQQRQSLRSDTASLLRSVAAVQYAVTPHGEARTSISSPGRRRTGMSLRDRLRHRSRMQRRIQQARNECSGPAAAALFPHPDGDEEDDSLEDNSNNDDNYAVQLVPATPPVNPLTSNAYQSSGSSSPTSTNHILLHVYDLIEKDTLMMLPPFGCVVEIGKCFADMNSALHTLGTGAYHVGVEINGVEYAFGATSVPNQTGVFTCYPRLSPGYQYRTTIDLGDRPLMRRSWVSVPKRCTTVTAADQSSKDSSMTVYRQVQVFVDGRQVMKEMAADYMGTDYDILRKNCCTFARDACLRMGVPPEEIPSWFRNLAESGAATQDLARATVEPLNSVLSLCEEPGLSRRLELETAAHGGVETIFTSAAERRVLVVEESSLYGLRRNSTWTY
jgi:hypothetical protein